MLAELILVILIVRLVFGPRHRYYGGWFGGPMMGPRPPMGGHHPHDMGGFGGGFGGHGGFGGMGGHGGFGGGMGHGGGAGRR